MTAALYRNGKFWYVEAPPLYHSEAWYRKYSESFNFPNPHHEYHKDLEAAKARAIMFADQDAIKNEVFENILLSDDFMLYLPGVKVRLKVQSLLESTEPLVAIIESEKEESQEELWNELKDEVTEHYAFQVPYNGSNNFYNEERIAQIERAFKDADKAIKSKFKITRR